MKRIEKRAAFLVKYGHHLFEIKKLMSTNDTKYELFWLGEQLTDILRDIFISTVNKTFSKQLEKESKNQSAPTKKQGGKNG